MVTSAGYVCRVAVTVVAPGMMREFGLSQTQMGTVFSAFLIGYTLFQIPSGWLADQVSCRPIYLALCCGWTLLTALTAITAWQGFAVALAIPQLWLVRMLVGVVTAPAYPTAGRTIAVAIKPPKQAGAVGLVFASLGIGSAIAPLMLAPAANRFGWRVALGFAALLTGVAGLVWWMFAPRHLRAAQDRGGEGAGTWLRFPRGTNDLRQPLKSVSFRMLCASYVLESYLGYIFVFWFYLYLVQVRHFQMLKAASVTTLPWIATVFAIPLGGLASDFAVGQFGETWGRRSVPLIALCAGAVFLVVGARTASAAVAVAALTLCTVLVLCTEGAFWATMAELSGTRSGIAGGVMNFGGNVGGVISPTLTPWLAAKMGWGAALTLTAALAVVAGMLWLGVRVGEDPRETLA